MNLDVDDLFGIIGSMNEQETLNSKMNGLQTFLDQQTGREIASKQQESMFQVKSETSRSFSDEAKKVIRRLHEVMGTAQRE